jgi:hypothetical protein
MQIRLIILWVVTRGMQVKMWMYKFVLSLSHACPFDYPTRQYFVIVLKSSFASQDFHNKIYHKICLVMIKERNILVTYVIFLHRYKIVKKKKKKKKKKTPQTFMKGGYVMLDPSTTI